MARLHHAKAAKDYPKHDIKKGEMYYWWKFMVGGRGGPKHYSKTRPRASQLTQSEFLGQLYDIQDDIAALAADDGLGDAVSEIAGRLQELADEQEEKKGNLPDSLQEAPSGELLQERTDACRSAADELEALTFDIDDKEEGESAEDFWRAKVEEVQAIDINES